MKKFKARNLQELVDELNELDLEILDYDYPFNDPQGHYDSTSLPTFGGDEPEDTLEIYSWEETHYMRYDNSWYIEKKEDV